MLELTGLGVFLRSLSLIYLVFAFLCVAMAIYLPKGWARKAISTVIALAIFGYSPARSWIELKKQQTYAKEAWAYFKKLCEEKSGEKIYRKITGTQSVLVVKPLPPASDRDHFDQYWYGDPYSAPATSMRARVAATQLTLDSRGPDGFRHGLEFVEVRETADGVIEYLRIHRPEANDKLAAVERVPEPVSRYGISWEDISTPSDRKYWVAGSRLSIVDLRDKSLVAERIGYFIETGFGSTAGQRRPWLSSRGPKTTCPPLSDGGYSDNWFIVKALVKGGEK